MISKEQLILILFLVYVGSALHIDPSTHRHHHRRRGEAAHQYDWGHYNSNSEPPMNQLRERWLSQIPDGRKITTLSIPGTHDTGTYDCRWWQSCDISQCQSWNIYWQLRAGIRFLDLRVNTDGKFTIGHGGYTYMDLITAFQDIKRFLD